MQSKDKEREIWKDNVTTIVGRQILLNDNACMEEPEMIDDLGGISNKSQSMDIDEIRNNKEYPTASWEMEVAAMPDKEWFTLSPQKKGKRKEIGKPCCNKNDESSGIIELSHFSQHACNYQRD